MSFAMAICKAVHGLAVSFKSWLTSKAGALCEVLHSGVQLHDPWNLLHQPPIASSGRLPATSSFKQ